MRINPDKACPCGSGRKYKYCCLARSAPIFAREQTALETALTEIPKEQIPTTGTVHTKKNIKANTDALSQAVYEFHEFYLSRLPHIKAYKKLRRTHGEIMDSMMNYLEQGKFTHKIDIAMAARLAESLQSVSSQSPSTQAGLPQAGLPQAGSPQTHSPKTASPLVPTNDSQFRLLQTTYDMNTTVGEQAYYEMFFYKMSVNTNSITEEFLQSNRYRKPEKVAMLHAMHNAVCGLFEIAEIDSQRGYILLLDVFTGCEYRIIDISMSMPEGASTDNYIYRRILTVDDISFGTGPALVFKKTDPFIVRFIERHKADYRPYGELIRFNELYNQYISDNNRIESVVHNI